MKNYNVYEYAKKNKLCEHSAINSDGFTNFFKDIKIKTVVEIGTYKGISAAFLAQFAKTVFTFDIKDYKRKYKIWDDLGVADKIRYFTVKGPSNNFEGKIRTSKKAVDIKEIIENLRFDFAFIDGEHTYEAVKQDFELVKKCGRVLFHDIHKKAYKGIVQFCNEIGAEIDKDGQVAYWSK
jgi:predicted O-methyltransferase YrrM